MRPTTGSGARALLAIGAFLCAGLAQGQEDVIPFDAERWSLAGARVVEHLGRQALEGTALLKDVELADGVIEVDIAVKGVRSYPGILFRRQSDDTLERFYVRPHRANGQFTDALQYTPVIGGIAGWQLYSGDGFTAPVRLPKDEWVHLRLEVGGTQARVFVGDGEEPALIVKELKHGRSKGAVGLMGPADGSAYFSNFKVRRDDSLGFDRVPEAPAPMGMLTRWELAGPFKASEIDLERTPEQQGLTDLAWQPVLGEPSGLVDIARFVRRTPPEPDVVWVRTRLAAEAAETRKLSFGYSDAVRLFLNGRLLFAGNSAYRSRDPQFAGIVGLNDTVYLPLQKGDNELLLAIAESFGGWGFMARDDAAVFMHPSLARLWELPRTLKYPESVVYDAARDVLYVSNYFNQGREFLSRVAPDGRVLELAWIEGLAQPTGLHLEGDRLFAVSRGGVVEIDVEAGAVLQTVAVPEAGMLNDVAGDPASGDLYVSDTRGNAIYRLRAGKAEPWLAGGEIARPNGLLVDDGELLVGVLDSGGEGCLKAVSLEDGRVRTVACLGAGAIVDGVSADGRGGYIVSDFNGRVYRISRGGEKTLLLDTSAAEIFCADLGYAAERGLLVIPSLYDNRLVAYRVGEE